MSKLDIWEPEVGVSAKQTSEWAHEARVYAAQGDYAKARACLVKSAAHAASALTAHDEWAARGDDLVAPGDSHEDNPQGGWSCDERGHHAWTWQDDHGPDQICDDCGAERPEPPRRHRQVRESRLVTGARHVSKAEGPDHAEEADHA